MWLTDLECVLAQLDKTYALGKLSQTDFGCSIFLNYTRDKILTVEEFLAGFYVKHDKFTELEFSPVVQGHMMLRHAKLNHNEQNMIRSQVSADYDKN